MSHPKQSNEFPKHQTFAATQRVELFLHTGKHHDPFLLVPILIIGLTLAGSGVGKHWRAECFSLVFVLLLFLLMNIDEPMATVPGLIVWIPGLTLLGSVKLPKTSHSTSLGSCSTRAWDRSENRL
jgi:hypothetical protein